MREFRTSKVLACCYPRFSFGPIAGTDVLEG